MMKKFGFTLAEVLVTLGIIGVIAALTAPGLIQTAGSAKVGPKLAKAVNSLEVANENLLTQEGIDRITSLSDYFTSLQQYMKIYYLGDSNYTAFSSSTVTSYNGAKLTISSQTETPVSSQTETPVSSSENSNGEGSSQSGDPDGEESSQAGLSFDRFDGDKQQGAGNINIDVDNSFLKSLLFAPVYAEDATIDTSYLTALNLGNKYITKDGSVYSIYTGLAYNKTIPSQELIGYVNIDINGDKTAPNRYGRDVFAFTLWNDGSLRPIGGHAWNGSNDADTWETKCTTGNITDGVYCTGSIFENDLKVVYQ